MKTTYRIAKLEWNILFYSPIAWFLTIIFLFQCSLDHLDRIQNLLTNQSLGGTYLNYLNALTAQLFSPPFGFFASVLRKVYLYLPLLTMGLISREVSSGTIKLVYSSPVKIKQLVLGKFLAIAAYNALLTGIMALICVTAVFNVKSPDIGILLSGLLGMFLLLCTYGAIGLFMSCLTSYQIVAALSTLVVFAILSYIGTIWQDIDFVRDLTYFLSLSNRSNGMLQGLLDSKNILYFIVVSAMFLGFAMVKLQSERESKSYWKVAVRYVGVFAFALFAGYLSEQPQLIVYFDATAHDTQTITPNTQRVLKEIGKEPLEVHSYINLLDQRYQLGQPNKRNADKDRWELYRRFKPDIKLKYTYFYDEPLGSNDNIKEQYPGKSLKDMAMSYAKAYKQDLTDFKTPEEIRKEINLRPEQNRYVMQLTFKGKTTFLRLFDDPAVFPMEAEVCAALKRLTTKVPVVGFLTDEFERSMYRYGETDFGYLANAITYRYSLVNQGFDTKAISLAEGDISDDIALLVIADPQVPFTPESIEKIRRYIDRGGNLLLAVEPGKQDILNELAAPWHVQMKKGMLLQRSAEYAPDRVVPLYTAYAAEIVQGIAKGYRDSIGESMPGVAGLGNTAGGPFEVHPLLMTNPKDTWLQGDMVTLDSISMNNREERLMNDTATATMLALTRTVGNKQQRIIIAGDADFLTPGSLTRMYNANNDFNPGLFSWFTNGEYPVDTSRPPADDNRLLLTMKGMEVLRMALLWVLPGGVLLFATIFLIRRRRK